MSSLKLKYCNNKNTWKSTLTSDTMQSCIQNGYEMGDESMYSVTQPLRNEANVKYQIPP